jgi:hypothetical protein
MTTTRWKHAVAGFFNAPSAWTNGVPTSGDTALLTVSGPSYAVSSQQDNLVGKLEMASNAILSIVTGDFSVTSGTGTGALGGKIAVGDGADLTLGTFGTSTTFDITGVIDITAGADATHLNIEGPLTLIGTGKITLSGNEAYLYGNDTNSTDTLTNACTIAGAGIIGNDPNFAFVNAAKGVIAANSAGNNLFIYVPDGFSNSGLMEATHSGTLYFQTGITQTAKGEIKAATSGSSVELNGITITGGVIATVNGSVLAGVGGSSEINTTTAIANAGTIGAESGNLTITGSVKNASTGALLAEADNSLIIDGSVTGGKATIDDTSFIEFGGPSSAKVIFSAGSTGGLVLGDATKFTGTVAGMSADPGAGIDLENIPFAHITAADVTYSATLHLLTVVDPTDHVTDKIKISGPAGTFTASAGFFGTTVIKDPLVAHANTDLLVQSMASFGASSGIAGSGIGSVAEHHTSSDFLAPNSHRG